MSAGQQVFRNVAVLGATGVGFGPVQGFGPAIVNSFLSNGKFKTNVRFLYRADSGKDEKKKVIIDSLSSKGAVGYPVDSSDVNSIAAALQGVDLVVSVLGAASLPGGAEKIFVDAAKQAGVKRFVVSYWGIKADSLSSHPLAQAKDDSIKYVTEAGLEWSAFVTGTWLEYIVGPFMGIDFEKFSAYVPEGGNFSFTASTISDVAQVVPYAVQHEASKNSFVGIAPNTTTWNELLQRLERAFGKKFTKIHKTSQELIELSDSLGPENWLFKMGARFLSVYPDASVTNLSESAFDRLYPEALAGVKFTTIEEFAHQLAQSSK